ncbi:hypothetical protein BDV26DRAFT_256024 [Aspergillus bertholletiae]|uniref:Uncharacterized protein n=1 Tax=Aspergillus bertholletiae TaxID=1226010 RepID=A0A5N7BH11_9EURO|nr:hypothetical protein BDV26DRAFT_256024 [Aspergillus bertholletiae]
MFLVTYLETSSTEYIGTVFYTYLGTYLHTVLSYIPLNTTLISTTVIIHLVPFVLLNSIGRDVESTDPWNHAGWYPRRSSSESPFECYLGYDPWY